jgi:peptide/nickel transport system ATP-binding protein
MTMNDTLIEIRNLVKWFPMSRGLFSSLFGKGEHKYIKAVDGISFEIKKGEILGLAGESGCGKSTTGMTLLRLHEASSGEILFNGADITRLTQKELKGFRLRMQMVFQDPYQSLNPRFTILDTIKEPLDIHRIGNEDERIYKVLHALERAELIPAEDFLDLYPHQLSGGQRQRVVIAKALVLNPEFIVADEPVSMLDVSIRASILNLLRDIADNENLGMLYISHDLSTIRHISKRTAIMYLGKIVEIGPTEEIINNAIHPYAHALLSAVPVPDPGCHKRKVEILGESSTLIPLPKGCRFEPRCPRRLEICKTAEPVLRNLENGHEAACHLAYKT